MLADDKMEEEYLLSSLGYEGLSFIEIERGWGRRCDLCVVRWSAAGVVWMRKNIRLQISGVEKSCMLKEYFFMMKDCTRRARFKICALATACTGLVEIQTLRSVYETQIKTTV